MQRLSPSALCVPGCVFKNEAVDWSHTNSFVPYWNESYFQNLADGYKKNLTINIHEHKQINCFFVSNPHFCSEKGFWVSRFTCSYTDFIISNSGHVYYECSPLYLWQKMGKSIIGSLLLNEPVLIYSTFLLKLLKHVYTTWWALFFYV